MATSLTCVVRRTLPQLTRLHCLRCTRIRIKQHNGQALHQRYGAQPQLSLHTSTRRHSLMEFFDDKENWGEEHVKVGRPWKLDELRLKASTDLHKLWYVLLKERNMLMTMEDEYKRQHSLFPNPERIEKVEESMENILEVVAERDRAYHLCEEGVTGEPGERQTYDLLGREFTRRNKEQYVPMELTRRDERREPWQERFLTLAEEKRLNKEDGYRRRTKRRQEEMRKLFPNADLD